MHREALDALCDTDRNGQTAVYLNSSDIGPEEALQVLYVCVGICVLCASILVWRVWLELCVSVYVCVFRLHICMHAMQGCFA